ncbi:ABC transporter ATP-binding protein [Haloplanus sp. GCM10025708]|uniref:ABC transporter ATP-binding protein n=1 Tax=Haloferacaceae TaxID=1644056 RepID=UPI00360EFA0C
MAEPLLEVENLRTHFDTEDGRVQAVDGISFSVEHGEIFGVVGESGSGKSVTARSIMQLIESPPGVINADAIRFKGEDLLEKSPPEIREIRGGEISMIFQDPMTSLNPVMTVGEQIAEVARHHLDTSESSGFWSEMKRKYVTGASHESESWRRAIELMDMVGLPDPEQRAHEYPHQLSGGMRQRVMIAQALAGDPSLIVADEPTTALDVSVEAQILHELLELRDEFDVSVVLITHDLGVIHETCDRLAVMYAGELMEKGKTGDVFEDPKHPYTQALMKSIPQITDDREWLDVIPGSVPDLVDKPAGCPFRERCEYAFEGCTEPLVEYDVGEKHTAACHLHSDEVNKELTDRPAAPESHEGPSEQV